VGGDDHQVFEHFGSSEMKEKNFVIKMDEKTRFDNRNEKKLDKNEWMLT
jgi:hypothetical protein